MSREKWTINSNGNYVANIIHKMIEVLLFSLKYCMSFSFFKNKWKFPFFFLKLSILIEIYTTIKATSIGSLFFCKQKFPISVGKNCTEWDNCMDIFSYCLKITFLLLRFIPIHRHLAEISSRHTKRRFINSYWLYSWETWITLCH